jgi:predicted GNAT family N-acyltransferase
LGFSYKIIQHNSPEYKAEVDLRSRVLREPLGLTFTAVELAAEANQLHVAAFTDDKLVGCLVLVIVNDSTLKMRQVAVEPEMQRQGIGQQLVSFAEIYAVDNGYCRIELHARDTAAMFYIDLGYVVLGHPFIEVTIPHFKMVKDWCAVIGG